MTLKRVRRAGSDQAPYTTFKQMSDVADQIAGSSNRAGRYMRQPLGYRAFIPATLPPVPPVQLEGELQFLLSDAERASEIFHFAAKQFVNERLCAPNISPFTSPFMS